MFLLVVPIKYSKSLFQLSIVFLYFQIDFVLTYFLIFFRFECFFHQWFLYRLMCLFGFFFTIVLVHVIINVILMSLKVPLVFFVSFIRMKEQMVDLVNIFLYTNEIILIFVHFSMSLRCNTSTSQNFRLHTVHKKYSIEFQSCLKLVLHFIAVKKL